MDIVEEDVDTGRIVVWLNSGTPESVGLMSRDGGKSWDADDKFLSVVGASEYADTFASIDDAMRSSMLANAARASLSVSPLA